MLPSMPFSRPWRNRPHMQSLFWPLPRSIRWSLPSSLAVRYLTLSVLLSMMLVNISSILLRNKGLKLKTKHYKSLPKRLMELCAMPFLSLTEWSVSVGRQLPDRPYRRYSMYWTTILILKLPTLSWAITSLNYSLSSIVFSPMALTDNTL